LTAGHARALVTAENPIELARRIVKDGLSVRAAEALARKPGANTRSTSRREPPAKDADTRALEADLAAALGLKVAITHDDKSGKGTITIKYRSLEELDDLCSSLTSAG